MISGSYFINGKFADEGITIENRYEKVLKDVSNESNGIKVFVRDDEPRFMIEISHKNYIYYRCFVKSFVDYIKCMKEIKNNPPLYLEIK